MKAVRWVRQEDPNGCLAACATMVHGVTYQYARQWFLDRGKTFDGVGGGLLDIDVMTYLGLHGFAYDRRYRWWGANQPRDGWLTPFAPVHVVGLGRLGWSIHLGGGPYIDLSVMPRLGDGVVLT